MATSQNVMLLPWNGHPQDAKKVSVTEAGRLRECKNTEYVWEQ